MAAVPQCRRAQCGLWPGAAPVTGERPLVQDLPAEEATLGRGRYCVEPQEADTQRQGRSEEGVQEKREQQEKRKV